jgi:hypothetical protein
VQNRSCDDYYAYGAWLAGRDRGRQCLGHRKCYDHCVVAKDTYHICHLFIMAVIPEEACRRKNYFTLDLLPVIDVKLAKMGDRLEVRISFH